MPFADLEQKRQYHRDYMRERRAGLTGKSAAEPTGALNPTEEPKVLNPNQTSQHTQLKVDGQWRRVIVRDGRLYDRDSGELIQAFTVTFE
jgi:hypothetical protein